MRNCTPNPARVWIDREAVAALRADREAGREPDRDRAMFKLWPSAGPIIPARTVFWHGATVMVYDPSRPSMREHASVWIETTAPVLADGKVYEPGSCEVDSYLATDGARTG